MENLILIEKEGLGSLEMAAHNLFGGDLPPFHLPGEVENNMKATGLDTDWHRYS